MTVKNLDMSEFHRRAAILQQIVEKHQEHLRLRRQKKVKKEGTDERRAQQRGNRRSQR